MLVISVLHHPFNWQNPENARQLRKHVEETSDVIITGHEHIASSSIKDNLDGNHTEFIEGAVLQDWENTENSGFNLILLDLENEIQKIQKYSWNGSSYEVGNETCDWFPYKRKKSLHKKIFEINSQFDGRLNDPGASFTHPNKSELTLKDIFVFPNLRQLGLEKTKSKDVIVGAVESEILCQINENGNKNLIIGAEKAGKTSLCMILYKHYYFEGYVPIYLEGHRIKSKSLEHFNKLVNRAYTEQYSPETLEGFSQLKNSKKLLIIDDFDKSKPSIKYKAFLVRDINEFYSNIIITANDLFQVEELTYEEKQKESVFEKYQQYKILEFGHLLRSRLICKWNTLGQEEYLEDVELTQKNDNATRIIDTIIGKNFVPSHPIFLLTILQTIEVGKPHNLKESSYGYYYEFLITQALSRTVKSDEIDAYYSYISELANYLFENNLREISKDNLLNKFHKWFCNEYKINLNFDKFIENLVNAFILDENVYVIRFRYKYVYYFFLAKYISDNIDRDDIKRRISDMCKRLYMEEFANVILFF